MSLSVARLTSKGQITLPLEVREFLSIQRGDRIMFRQERNRVYLERLPANVPSAQVFGKLRRPGMEPMDLEAARAKAREPRAKRVLGCEGQDDR
ncbi:MAG: AbrB/MazE/SpoVT family DNA-binding domain-containing protein [Firmicutes bacterium]|jgi:AbrB family looped-hinge helix DNA binding protein|nr:AbrB/MazE/SpoVT family DNA-binding domain-containing protein [Bacillota bacterium]MDH7495703.1 AbrB/MazE/SpoVT family DNA-binding domain-containing protein [Bacillota bacterium]